MDCDSEFVRDDKTTECVRDKTKPEPPIPKPCDPGTYYNRTQGYKTEGFDCDSIQLSSSGPVQVPCPFDMSGEFLIVAEGKHISKMSLDGSSQKLPVKISTNAFSIDFDQNNCLLWGESTSKRSGKIMHQCFDGTKPEVLMDAELDLNTQISYDWVSQILYYNEKVNIITAILLTSNEHRKLKSTFIEGGEGDEFKGIAVHPAEGFLFFSNSNPSNPSISRINLNGEDRKVLLNAPQVTGPSKITIDMAANRIYWTDSVKKIIGGCDMDGGQFKELKRYEQEGNPELFIYKVRKLY